MHMRMISGRDTREVLLTAEPVRTADDAPTLPGAYVLLVELPAALTVALSGKPATTLEAGRFLYCGSANGPGGIRARLARHMRVGKSIHWHVDRLTEAVAVLGAWVFPGGNECELVQCLSHLTAPIAGFGSSDCRSCFGHLLSWPACEGSNHLQIRYPRQRYFMRQSSAR